MKRFLPFVLLLLSGATAVHAIGPHELALLVRKGDKESKAIARLYADLRKIPAANIVEVTVPGKGAREIGIEEFRKSIYVRVNDTLERRGLAGHIQAWVYSVGFPTRVKVEDGFSISLHGATFVRGEIPEQETVLRGKVSTKLFAAPSMPDHPAPAGRSLDAYSRVLNTGMPLCSMSLGVTGQRANTTDEIRRCLVRAKGADATAPRGTVYLYDTDDVRSVARDWQFKAAAPLIDAGPVTCRIEKQWQGIEKDALGIMVGLQRVDFGEEMLPPGAFAEHLTSYAAHFDNGTQTKLSEWIRRGAAASAGTVVEPRAIWMKFPHAQFYVHYTAGLTMIESLYQSVRSPMETLLVGDPLAQPWKSAESLSVTGLKPVPEGARLSLQMKITGKDRSRYNRFEVYVDGRRVGTYFESAFTVTMPQRSAREYRDLRVVAVKSGRIRTRLTYVADEEEKP